MDVELVAANFSTAPASVAVSYYREDTTNPLTSAFTIQPGERKAVPIYEPSPIGIGRNGGVGHRVGMQLQATGALIVVERATYFASPPP